MAHDVFISHSVKDKAVADAVCATLESSGIRCWIAPRDIMPGADWGESILKAISNSRLMVLIFSSAVNTSPPIRAEIELAFKEDITIIPFRIENVVPGKKLEFFLTAPQWLDAYTGELQSHTDYLIKVASRIIGVRPDTPPQGCPPPESQGVIVQVESSSPKPAVHAISDANIDVAVFPPASAPEDDAPAEITDRPDKSARVEVETTVVQEPLAPPMAMPLLPQSAFEAPPQLSPKSSVAPADTRFQSSPRPSSFETSRYLMAGIVIVAGLTWLFWSDLVVLFKGPHSQPEIATTTQAAAVEPTGQSSQITPDEFKQVVGLSAASTLEDAVALYGDHYATGTGSDSGSDTSSKDASSKVTNYTWSTTKGGWLTFEPGAHILINVANAPDNLADSPPFRLVDMSSEKRDIAMAGCEKMSVDTYGCRGIGINVTDTTLYVVWHARGS